MWGQGLFFSRRPAAPARARLRRREVVERDRRTGERGQDLAVGRHERDAQSACERDELAVMAAITAFENRWFASRKPICTGTS